MLILKKIFSNILDDLKNNLGNRKVSLLLKDITEFDKEICKIAGFIFLEKYESNSPFITICHL